MLSIVLSHKEDLRIIHADAGPSRDLKLSSTARLTWGRHTSSVLHSVAGINTTFPNITAWIIYFTI